MSENTPRTDQTKFRQTRPIDVDTARRLFVARYRQLFGDKYFLNSVDGKYSKLPNLDVGALDKVEESASGWIIRVAPPAGLTVSGRVDLAGAWVDIEIVDFATE